MAKLNKQEQARRDGMDYFVRIYHAQDVRIPELDEEIEKRNITGAPIGLDNKQVSEWCLNVKRNILQTVLLMTEWVLHDKLGYGKTRLERFVNWFNDAADSLDRDYISWGDIQYQLEEETGIHSDVEWFGEPVKMERLDPRA